jgi:hypothetical protein
VVFLPSLSIPITLTLLSPLLFLLPIKLLPEIPFAPPAALAIPRLPEGTLHPPLSVHATPPRERTQGRRREESGGWRFEKSQIPIGGWKP